MKGISRMAEWIRETDSPTPATLNDVTKELAELSDKIDKLKIESEIKDVVKDVESEEH